MNLHTHTHNIQLTASKFRSFSMHVYRNNMDSNSFDIRTEEDDANLWLAEKNVNNGSHIHLCAPKT